MDTPTPQKNRSLADKIIKAGFIVGIAQILLKFVGLILSKCYAHYLDNTQFSILISIGLEMIIMQLFFIGEETIRPTFLTQFVKERDNKSEADAFKFANTTLSFQALLLLVVVTAIMAFPDFFINLFSKVRMPEALAAGATQEAMEAYDKALREYTLLKEGLRYMAPALFFLSMGTTTYVILNGYKKFFLAAFGDSSTKIFSLIGFFIGWKAGMNLNALYLGLFLGSIAKVATHLYGMRDKLHYLRPSFVSNSAFKGMLLLILPLLIGVFISKYREIFNNSYVLSGIVDRDAVLKANSLGRKMYMTINSLVPYALQIALFPFLCDLANSKDKSKLGEIVNNSCRLLLSVFIPVSATILVLGVPLTVLIFLGGKTSVNDAYLAGLSTTCYSLVLPAAALECVLMQGALADQKTTAVTVIGVITSLLSVVISYIVIIQIGVSPTGALLTVALAFVVTKFLKSILLILNMRRTTPVFPFKSTAIFLVKTLLLAVLVAGIAYAVSKGVSMVLPDGVAKALKSTAEDGLKEVSRIKLAINLAVTAGAAVVAYIAFAFLLKLEEPKQMIQWTFGKAFGKFAKKFAKH